MPSTPDTGGTATAPVDEQFLDLLCSDDDLLAAEFDAIIAAEWSQPPTDRSGRSTTSGHPGGSAARRIADPVRGPVSRPRHPGADGWVRQRSPPVPDTGLRQ